MRIDKIEDEDKTQFDSIKAEFISYLGYDVENRRPMAMHPTVFKRKDSIDQKAIEGMTDADFLAMLVELWQQVRFEMVFEALWQSESFSKFKSTLFEPQFQVGDNVFHECDAKEPHMLMHIDEIEPDGKVWTTYIDKKFNGRRWHGHLSEIISSKQANRRFC